MELSTKRPVQAVISAFCRSYTEAERQHLFKVTRLFIACYYFYVSYYGLFVVDFTGVDNPIYKDLGVNWWLKCISVWNIALQILYFLYCTIFIDFADSGPGKAWIKPRLQNNIKIRDFVFISLVFPITIQVCVMFWTICAINKPLLYPNEMSAWIPDWFNHAIHTNPIVLTLFEATTTKHRLPKMTESAAGLFAFIGSYVACLLYNKFTAGRWVYLFIEEITDSLIEVITYFTITAVITPLIFLVIGYKLSSRFSSVRTKDEKKIS